MWRLSFVLGVAIGIANSATAAPSQRHASPGMTLVGPGVYRPLYPASPAEREVPVKMFLLDTKPVTNGEFLAFVRTHQEWRRDAVKRVLADPDYLVHWEGPDSLGPTVRAASPVTYVSWFAAKAFCAARSARLPTEREWELAALATEAAPDGSRDPAWTARILRFYSEPASSPALGDVGKGKPNYWGVYDMHGLIWEWIYDFGASLVTSDSREKGAADQSRFCGASGADSQNPADYASFMRIAFRSSLEAPYTTARLGFRCARDMKETR
jgi:formylglycine-generating enzyme required for sulfatase activity